MRQLAPRYRAADEAMALLAQTDYLAGRRDAYSVEFRERTGSGDWAWIQSSGTIVERDGFERPVRVLGIHVTITGRKRA